MCGIGGFYRTQGQPEEASQRQLQRMAAALAHRGPDAEGFWLAERARVGFCHRRLAIIDLTEHGAQPMTSGDGRWTITFNGELYDHARWRAALTGRGLSLRGGSDTEVLIEAIGQYGLERVLRESRGMFAFALFDARERTLWLARDRFGEKPLYWSCDGRELLFASELHALRALPGFAPGIDRAALASLLRQGCIAAPLSIYRGVRKLLPGHLLRVRARGEVLEAEERPWFAAPEAEAAAGGASVRCSPQEALERTEAALLEAVRLQQVADVPVGAFLSGGIDSSLVVAHMQQVSTRAVRTFTIGFEDPTHDEAPFARAVAQQLGTAHTELTVSAQDALEVIPDLPRIYDEPFADSSQIPTALVCALARREVTVALSGDGGDELFAGYPRYGEVAARWGRLQRLPAGLRRPLAQGLASAPRPLLQALAGATRRRAGSGIPERMRERVGSYGADSVAALYASMSGLWVGPDLPVPDAPVRITPADRPGDGRDPVAAMQRLDLAGYLPDDILVKVDRAAMAVSLETRVPLLDAGVARVARSIPTAVHFNDGRGKWVLRTLLARHLPPELIDRPKRGFAVPLAGWLRGELREWAEALLDPVRLRREGWLDPAPIRQRWDQHQRGQTNWSAHLWSVLMFESWLEQRHPAVTLEPQSPYLSPINTNISAGSGVAVR